MSNADLVRRFYADLWDRHDRAVAWEILAQDFDFRGSLGADQRGVAGFLDYLDKVRAALGNYRSEIGEMVEAPGRIAVWMRFSGDHRGEFFGVAATGKRIAWQGAAFFGFAEGRIARLWVLGDIDAVKAQLGAAAARF